MYCLNSLSDYMLLRNLLLEFGIVVLYSNLIDKIRKGVRRDTHREPDITTHLAIV